MKHRFRLAAQALLLGTCLTAPARAFQADGFWTGMTTPQFLAIVGAYGLVARPGQAGQWLVGTRWPPAVVAEVGFCGDYLVAYRRAIRSDADYAGTLAAIFATYGPPRKMNFDGDVATDTTAGAFRAAGETLWGNGSDRVRMHSSFDWRVQQGRLRREQPATVQFESRSPCSDD
jgi:hypothetical protein